MTFSLTMLLQAVSCVALACLVNGAETQSHLRTGGWSQVNHDSSLHSAAECPSRESLPVSDVLNLVTRNYITEPWLEGGVMTLNDLEWTTVTGAVGGFVDPNIFISLPKLPGIVSNEGVSAVPRVRQVSILTVDGDPGHPIFQTKLYQANSSLCSKQWRIPTTIGDVTVSWMAVETGAYNISGNSVFVNHGPVTREDYDPSNNNNFVRINHPLGCDSSTTICAFPSGTVSGAIAQIQTLVYDRHLFIRAFNSRLRFSRFVLQPHDSSDLSYYVMTTPETVSFMSFELNKNFSCLEDWGMETTLFEDVTNAALVVSHDYTYREIPGTFGIVGTVVGLVDSTTVRVFEESISGVSFMLQEDQCMDLETDHTTKEDVWMLTMGRLEAASAASCIICQVVFTPYVPTEQPTLSPSAAPSSLTSVPTAGGGRLEFIGDSEQAMQYYLANVTATGADILSYEESIWGSLHTLGGSVDWGTFAVSARQREGLFSVSQVSLYAAGAACANCPNTTAGRYKIDITCTHAANMTTLVNSLSGTEAVTVECGGHTWKSEFCSADNSMRVCVDCASPCGCSSVQSAPLLFPADSACWSPSGGAAQTLIVEYTPSVATPSFHVAQPLLDTFETSAERMMFRVDDVSGEGFLRCAAVPTSELSSVTSFHQISSWSRRKYFNTTGSNITIDVSNIAVGVGYSTICSVESIVMRDFSSTLADAKSKATTFSVSELKTVSMTFGDHRLPAGQISSAFQVKVNALPASNVVFIPTVYHTTARTGSGACSTDINLYSVQSDKAFPSSLSFTFLSSLSLSKTFYLSSTLSEGCVFVTVAVSGSSSGEFNSVLDVDSPNSFSSYVIVDLFGSSGPALAPALSAATISSDGQSLEVEFDSATDRGVSSGLVGLSQFACSTMFTFTGDSSSQCVFISDKTVKVSFPVSTPASSVALASPGDSFALKPSTIKAACVSGFDCSSYVYSTATSVSVDPPNEASLEEESWLQAPAVILQAPVEVSVCEDLVLTYGMSQGGAGREWSSIEWTVESEQGVMQTALTSTMNANTVLSASHLTVAKANLQSGLYVIHLKLTNFLGNSGHDSVLIRVHGDNSVLPSVVLSDMGAASRQDAVYLQGVVAPSPCNVPEPSGGGLLGRFTYTWNVYENGVLSTSIMNQAVQPTDFFIPKNSLSVNSGYEFELITRDTFSGGVVKTSVSLPVESRGVSAVISNGDEVVTARDLSLVLDSSDSYDLDGVSSLTFQWTCVQMSPVSTSCDNILPSSTSSILNLPANSLTSGGEYVFTVAVSNSAGAADSSDIKVLVSTTTFSASSHFASTTIDLAEGDERALDRIVNAQNEIIVEASVAVTGETVLTWTQQQAGGSTTTTLLTLDYNQDASTNIVVPFRLAAGSLSPSTSYTLQLHSEPYGCVGSCSSSYSEVTFQVNGVPSVGAFDVTPSSGVAGYDGDMFSLMVSNCIDDDMPLQYSFVYTQNSQSPVLLTGSSTRSVLDTALPLGGDGGLSGSNIYPLEVSVFVDDSLGARTETSTTVNTLSPFHSLSDSAALTQALEDSVSNGVRAALAVEDYSYLATLVDIGISLVENAVVRAQSTVAIDTSTVENVAADVTVGLLSNITAHLEHMDLFLSLDQSLFASTVQICQSFAEGTVLQTHNRADVILAANTYATALDELFTQSSVQTLDLGTGILKCFDSILTAVDNFVPSVVSEDQHISRRLQTVTSAATVTSALALMSSFKDLMLLGEIKEDTLDSVAYHVDKGWPFALSALSSKVFPLDSQQQSSSSVGFADFNAAIDLFDLGTASEYSVELLAINGLDSATCEHDLDPCSLVGSFNTNKHVLTIQTSESPSLPTASAVSSTLPQSYNVLPSLTPHDSTTLYELSCPVITDPSQTVTVFVSCDEAATLGPAEDMSLVCSSTVQGDWQGDCPLYATDVICGNMQGEDVVGDNVCRTNYTSSTHSTCVCDISPAVSAASGGQQVYVFDASSSLLLGRDKIESSIVSVPSQNSHGGGSSDGDDLWYVIMFIGIGLAGICFIYLIVWCCFRCLAGDDDEKEGEQEQRMAVRVQAINEYDEKTRLTDVELVEKKKEDELKTSAQIKFAHNFTQGKLSNEENCYRTAKSYFKYAIEVSKEDKACGNNSIDERSIALCYVEYAEVLEKLGESQESIAMYKKAYVLDKGIKPSKQDPNKPRTLGELKRQLSSSLEDESPEEDLAPEMFNVDVPPPRDLDGHVWSPKLCDNSSFCQICDGYINGDTEREQFVFQCNNCHVYGHRDCLVVDMPPCSRGSRASSAAEFFSSLSSRARGMFSGKKRGGRRKKDKEIGYDNIVSNKHDAGHDSDDSFHSRDLDSQPEMTNLFDDDTNDINFTTMEQKVDARGRKSVALQSVKITNPAPKSKSILKNTWSDTDAYHHSGRDMSPSPPPTSSSQQDKLLHRQASDSSDYSPSPDTDTQETQGRRERSGVAKSSSSRRASSASSSRRVETTNQDGLTTYEMIDHNKEAFNL